MYKWINEKKKQYCLSLFEEYKSPWVTAMQTIQLMIRVKKLSNLSPKQ